MPPCQIAKVPQCSNAMCPHTHAHFCSIAEIVQCPTQHGLWLNAKKRNDSCHNYKMQHARPRNAIPECTDAKVANAQMQPCRNTKVQNAILQQCPNSKYAPTQHAQVNIIVYMKTMHIIKCIWTRIDDVILEMQWFRYRIAHNPMQKCA